MKGNTGSQFSSGLGLKRLEREAHPPADLVLDEKPKGKRQRNCNQAGREKEAQQALWEHAARLLLAPPALSGIRASFTAVLSARTTFEHSGRVNPSSGHKATHKCCGTMLRAHMLSKSQSAECKAGKLPRH